MREVFGPEYRVFTFIRCLNNRLSFYTTIYETVSIPGCAGRGKDYRAIGITRLCRVTGSTRAHRSNRNVSKKHNLDFKKNPCRMPVNG